MADEILPPAAPGQQLPVKKKGWLSRLFGRKVQAPPAPPVPILEQKATENLKAAAEDIPLPPSMHEDDISKETLEKIRKQLGLQEKSQMDVPQEHKELELDLPPIEQPEIHEPPKQALPATFDLPDFTNDVQQPPKISEEKKSEWAQDLHQLDQPEIKGPVMDAPMIEEKHEETQSFDLPELEDAPSQAVQVLIPETEEHEEVHEILEEPAAQAPEPEEPQPDLSEEREKLESLKSELEQRQIDLDKLKLELDERQKSLDDKLENFRKEKQEVEAQKITAAGMINKCEFKEKQYKKEREELDARKLSLDKMQSDLDERKASLDKMQDDLDKRISGFEAKEKEFAQQEAEMANLKKETEEINGTLPGLRAEREKLQSDISRYEEQLKLSNQLEETMRHREEAIKHAEEKLVELESKIKEQGFSNYLQNELKTSISPPKLSEHEKLKSKNIEIYNMIEECKGHIWKNNLDEAKKCYLKLREKYQGAELDENEKNVLYTAIRELYDDIHLASINSTSAAA